MFSHSPTSVWYDTFFTSCAGVRMGAYEHTQFRTRGFSRSSLW